MSATSSDVRLRLRSLLLGTEIDGTKLSGDWFPSVDCEVFISHSHKDVALAALLAERLSQLKIKCFIDSSVWGYADELLQEIDNTYCPHSSGSGYSYEKRNGSTSHVHMMLGTALAKMLDKCECVIFLNTPNSISIRTSTNEERTYSPWIYHELSMLEVLRKQEPSRWPVQESFSGKEVRASVRELKVSYSIDLTKLPSLSLADIRNSSAFGGHPLDYIYSHIN